MACVLRWQQAAALLLALLALAGSAQALFVIEKGALKIKFPRGAAQAHREGFDVSMANFGSPKYGGELMCGPQEQACWGIACLDSKAGSSAHDLTDGSPRCSGKLVYPDKEHGHPNTCVPSCNFACQNFSVSGLMCYLSAARTWPPLACLADCTVRLAQSASPPFKLNHQAEPGQRTNYIMLVDRGPRPCPALCCSYAALLTRSADSRVPRVRRPRRHAGVQVCGEGVERPGSRRSGGAHILTLCLINTFVGW